MQTIKVLIVEDEMIVAKDIAYYLEELGCEVCGLLMEGEQVLPFLDKEVPDIILMDIMLKGKLDGISTVHLIRKHYKVPIIYLTANTDDQSFELAKATQPFAFIEKPFKKKALKRTFELLIEQISHERTTGADSFILQDRIFVRENNNVMVKINLEEILYIEAERAYCQINTAEKSHLITSSLSNLEQKLSSPFLMRVHRSYLVNLRQIDRIEENRITIGSKNITVSRSYWKDFLNRVKII
ncbi:MAG: LytTR family transcriptional regulator DNA-binding domain-containing protein [Lewinella sp.]|nr:LytTR family transcriptional regulator DNA-binding domain-containing protein [Lewinella sp.]